MLRISFGRLLAGLVAVAILHPHCFAQVIDPVTAAQTPVSGAGHHYVGTGVETVNPADGSLTFELPLQTPAGRELSFPFGIRYNSSEPFYLSGNGASLQFAWQTPTGFGNAPPFSLNGWSYDLPNYTAQAFLAGQYADSSSPGQTDIQYNYCWATQNYRFNGFDHSHALSAAYGYPDPGNPQPQLSAAICQQAPFAGFGGPYSQGGDDGVSESFGTVPSNVSSSTQPSLTVTDKSGTVFYFPQGPSLGGSGPIPFGALAQTITDRNGNQINLSTASGSPGDSGGLGLGSYLDTLGRTIVSWSGLGGTPSNPQTDTLAISGLGNVTVKWEMKTITSPTNYQVEDVAPEGVVPSTSCHLNQTSISMSVVSEIDLPNGQKYLFTWADPTTGRLSKIQFPGGGYVRYVWGTDPLSIDALISFNLATAIPYASGTVYCWVIADTPAITDRFVSFDGQTEVLHQSFSYNTPGTNAPGTSWTNDLNGGTGEFGPGLFWTSKITTVTTTDEVANQTTITQYTYSPAPVGAIGPNDHSWQSPDPAVPVEKTVVYQDGSGATFETVNKTWFDQYSMVGVQTILNSDNAHGVTTIRCVDRYDRVLATYEYDFPSSGGTAAFPSNSNGNCEPAAGTTSTNGGSLSAAAIGKLLRQTITSYHVFPSGSILDEPDSVTVEDGSGNIIRQTTYAYDHGTVTPSGVGSPLLVSPPGGSSSRGNPTSVSQWLNTTNSFLTTGYAYYDTGQVHTKTEPCAQAAGACPDVTGATSQVTTYTYSDNFASGTGSYSCTAPGCSSQTNAYLSGITYPNTGVAHTESFAWGYLDGLLRSHTDQNGQTTNYCYATGGCTGTVNDPLLRLTGVQGPPDPNNNNQRPTTTYAYTDWISGSTLPATSTIEKLELENLAGNQIKTSSVIDGMGHQIESQITSDVPSTTYTRIKYDGLGREYQAWNPTRCDPIAQTSCPAESTWGIASYGYDALSRKITETDADGVSTQAWSYQSNTVTYTDEDKNQWQRSTDALGRLARVLEPTGSAQTGSTQSPTLETDYGYDLSNDLLSVTQCGSACPSSSTVARAFTYDSLSRLIQAFNPEAGWTCYGITGGAIPNGSNCTGGYDADGNLVSKTDARAIATTYSYDALNRMLGKSFSNDPGSTPSSCFQYDASAVPYSTGRLTSQWTQSVSLGGCSGSAFLTKRSILQYDPEGHIMQEKQYTFANQSQPYNPQYSYDLAGNLITSTDGTTPVPTTQGATLTFTSCWDTAGHLGSLTSNWNDGIHPQSLFAAQTAVPGSSACPNPSSVTLSNTPYAPFGGLQSGVFGNTALTQNQTFDNRLRVNGQTDTAASKSLGTKSSATITITGAEQTQ